MPVQSKPVVAQNDNISHALAGAGGGILSMILTYPLITLSTRAQVESRRAATPFLEAVQRIVAREGLAGLFAGLDSALFGISVTNFVYYYWYEWARAAFAARRRRSSSARLTTVESMLAGALAGSATVLITNPIWVVNTRMTTRRQGAPSKGEAGADDAAPSPSGRSPTTVGTLLALLRHEGPLALFAGVVPALVLVANPILQYTLFEQLRNAVERRRPVTPAIAFVLGALGKLFATTVTYPYITVKSQMHVATRPADREGMRQAISRVVRDEGYAGLYKGIGPKVTQSVLTAAFLFAFKDILYEQSVRLRTAMAQRALSKAARKA